MSKHIQELTNALKISPKEISFKIENDNIVFLGFNRWGMDNRNLIDFSPLKSLKTLKRLEFVGYQFENIDFLDDLNNLTALSIDRGGIKKYDSIGNLSNLTFLQLEGNEIREDCQFLSKLTNLTTLIFTCNAVSNLSPLKDLVNLAELKLYYNYESNASFLTGLQKLKKLEYYENEVKDIAPLKELTNLEHLNLQFNKISNIQPLTNLKNLKALFLSNNRIKNITSLSNLTNLNTLTLRLNQVEDISVFQNLQKLEELEVSYNKIADITALSGLTNLKILNITDNKINDFSPIKHLQKIEELDIQSNPIKDFEFLKNFEGKKIQYTKPEPEKPKKEAKPKIKFTPITDIAIKPEYIFLEKLDKEAMASALESLIKIADKLNTFESLHFEKNPIKFYTKPKDAYLLYDNWDIKNFITEASKHQELVEQINNFFEKISNECVYVSGDYYFRELICEYACLKKENVKYYINFLSSIEEDTDLEYEDVNAIIETHQWCNETVDLILHRYFANSPVPHGKDQFVNAIEEEGLNEFLENKANFNYFFKKTIEILKDFDEEDFESYLNDEVEEFFNIVFSEDDEEAEKYFKKAMKEIEKNWE